MTTTTVFLDTGLIIVCQFIGRFSAVCWLTTGLDCPSAECQLTTGDYWPTHYGWLVVSQHLVKSQVIHWSSTFESLCQQTIDSIDRHLTDLSTNCWLIYQLTYQMRLPIINMIQNPLVNDLHSLKLFCDNYYLIV